MKVTNKRKKQALSRQAEAALAFRAQVKSEAALRGLSMGSLCQRIGRTPSTLSWALREPWRFPLVVKLIESELFGGRVVYFGTKEEKGK